MSKTLREIVEISEDLFIFTINKNDDFDRSSWEFKITDKRSDMYGLSDKFGKYNYKIVTLRRGEHFFIAYKFNMPDNKIRYFVDIRKAGHKTSVPKYVDGLVRFYMKSNDISYKKNDNSFKVSEMKMKTLYIDNFLDLCYYFREFSAIGIGITRDVRNLIVLDIDVDCCKKENNDELKRILYLFAENGILPDFEIHNNENGHIQLQWLIQSYKYKKKCDEQIKELISRLENDKNKEREVSGVSLNFNFTMDTDDSMEYRILTKSLTDISDKPKFGDKNFTFWKAKNFCTALFKLQNLELKMPKYVDGKIEYLSQEDMVDLFSKKEYREQYFKNAPEFKEIVEKAKNFLSNHMDVERIKSEICTSYNDYEIFDSDSSSMVNRIYDDSRNNFVFRHTKTVTWNLCRELNLKSFEDIAKMLNKDLKKLENSVHKIVRDEYDRLDKKYGGGKWPGTSNDSPFSKKEFESAFKMAFNFAKCKFNNISKYSDEQRNNSLRERGLKKDMKLILVDYYRNKNKDLKRGDLLNVVNDTLRKSGQKEISLSSLKRYIIESKSMDSEKKERLYKNYYENLNERKKLLVDIQKDNDKKKTINKKKLEYISINIVDEIMKNIEN